MLFGAAPWQCPESSCARALSGAVTGGRSSAVPHVAGGEPREPQHSTADGYRAGLRLLELLSRALGSLVQCWVMHSPRGARCSGG